MRTLIVLCAGNRKVNNMPLYLNIHPKGMTLAEMAIEGIYPERYNRIIFTITRSADDKNNAAAILSESIGDRYPIEVCILEKATNGPAHTVYETIKKFKVKGELAVRDSLNSIILEKNIYGNFIAGLDLTTFDEEVYKVRSKSFIIMNEQKKVLDVVEKRFRSDVISVGLYGFKSTDDFIFAYEKLNDGNYPIQKIYVSNVISYLIGYKKQVFHCCEVKYHEDWGSDETWNLLQRKYEICFIDIDGLNTNESEKIVDIILDKYGVQKRRKQSFILFTCRKYIDIECIQKELLLEGINCLGVISECPHTNKKVLITNKDELRIALMEV